MKKTTIRRRPRFPISSSVDGRRRSPLVVVRGNVANFSWKGCAPSPRGRAVAALRWSSRGAVAYLDVQESILRRRQGMKSERWASTLSNQLLIQYSFLRGITFHLHAPCPTSRPTVRAFRNPPRSPFFLCNRLFDG